MEELNRPRVLFGATECSTCRMQMEQGSGKRTLHPVQYLALAYGLLPEVARLLNLTEEQQKKFKEMRVEARKELAELISSKDREGRNEKLAKLREAVDKKIEAVLTDEQKAKAKELVGETFKGKLVFEEGE